MDGFGDNFVGGGEDPAADFLAREQDQLAGLDDDLAAPAAAPPADAAAPPADDTPAPPAAGADGDADLFGGVEAPVNGVGVGGDLESFEMVGGIEAPQDTAAPPAALGLEDLPTQPPGGEDPWPVSQPPPPTDEGLLNPAGEEDLGVSEPLSDGLLGEGFPEAPAPQGDYSGLGEDFGGEAGDVGAFSFMGDSAPAEVVAPPEPARSPVPPVVREEPEKIRLWREQQRVRLEEKDAAESKNKDELKEKAKTELEEWYRQHEEQVAKTRQANRSAEKELVAESGAMEPGTEWERITKLCDFNPKTAKSSRDISRMRSIILQVKQNPPIKA